MQEKRSRASTSQTTLHQQIQTTQYYGKDSKRQKAITKKLVVFVGATNVPLSLVDREEFHALLSEMTVLLIGRNLAKKSIRYTAT